MHAGSIPVPAHAALYRMPWSLTDNPIGWVEITDTCNITCEGCYRDRLTGHKDLSLIKEEIDFMRAQRNCDNISIAGGEPLLHPHLEEILGHVKQRGMKATMLTNGVKLSYDRLRVLKAAGLTHLTIHVDSRQTRPRWTGRSETELNELRLRLAKMVASVGGLEVMFNSTVYPETLHEVPEIVRWAERQIDLVAGLVFITYRGVPIKDGWTYEVAGKPVSPRDLTYATEETHRIDVDTKEVYRTIKAVFPDFAPCAYLGGSVSHDSFKWLITSRVGSRGKVLGYVGPTAAEIYQMAQHKLRGRYPAYLDSYAFPRTSLAGGVLDAGLRRTALSWLRASLRNPAALVAPLRAQAIVMVQAPDVLPTGEVDMCDGCPDMTLWKGQLVRSCRLDELRKYGGWLTSSCGATVAQSQAAGRPGPQPVEAAS